MRLLVCGSRTFSDERIIRLALFGALAEAHALMGGLDVIHGAAPGADTLAGNIAINDLLDVEEYPADWDTHDRKAGPIRNQQMLDEGKPDVVLAFVDKPLAESKGTADMVRRTRKAGVPTYVVQGLGVSLLDLRLRVLGRSEQTSEYCGVWPGPCVPSLRFDVPPVSGLPAGVVVAEYVGDGADVEVGVVPRSVGVPGGVGAVFVESPTQAHASNASSSLRQEYDR